MRTRNSRAKPSSPRITQADHHDRMARLSDAYAAAFEGDLQFAAPGSQQTYVRQRARAHRKDAEARRVKAKALRQV